MIIEVKTCHNYQSRNIIRNGKNLSGRQRYKCKDCDVTRVLDPVRKSRNLDMEQVSQTYQKRKSFRSTGRIFGVNHVTVQKWLKKARSLAPFRETNREAQAGSVPETNEVSSFVFLKIRQIRIWIAQWRQTRQIISFFIGDGSVESCEWLWRKLPYAYLKSNSFSDFWKAYNCIPQVTHLKVGKETGETAHIKILSNTIGQRFSRLVQKSLSFSKQVCMLNLHFKLWAHRYNLNLLYS